MKIFLTIVFTAVISLASFAQELAVETNFEKNKRNYSLTKFGYGEDASSGWDYLVYRQKTSTKKIREIWSNYAEVKVEDYYFEAGKPVLLVENKAKKSQYKSLKNGSKVTLSVVQKFYFANSKLVKWFENGKVVPATDPRWADMEKNVLASFEEQLENFRAHLRGEL